MRAPSAGRNAAAGRHSQPSHVTRRSGGAGAEASLHHGRKRSPAARRPCPAAPCPHRAAAAATLLAAAQGEHIAHLPQHALHQGRIPEQPHWLHILTQLPRLLLLQPPTPTAAACPAESEGAKGTVFCGTQAQLTQPAAQRAAGRRPPPCGSPLGPSPPPRPRPPPCHLCARAPPRPPAAASTRRPGQQRHPPTGTRRRP